jgi:hypothetical protein
MSSSLAGWLFTLLTDATITVAAFRTMFVAMARAHLAMKERAWSEQAIAWSVLGLFLVLFTGGWLLLDIWWVLKALRRGARRALPAAR